MAAEDKLLDKIRIRQKLTLKDEIELIIRLSIPSILAQISTIIMFYIDAAMVGSLGAAASASIGLVSSSMWMCGGLCSAVSMGFSVQVAHMVGGGDFVQARNVLRQGLIYGLSAGLFLCVIGMIISPVLPVWLGGGSDIIENSSKYFFIFALGIPFMQLNYLSASMHRCSGNMRLPSILNTMMCFLDVVFNYFLIFPSKEIDVLGLSFIIPRADLGVQGAALGTMLAFVVTSFLMSYTLCFKSKYLNLRQEKGSFKPQRSILKKALKICTPMGAQNIAMCSAQIASTLIVAPLGTIAIAAHSFAITAESLCYMPGYGTGDAATTLVGQSVGARRPKLTVSFARISVSIGMIVMTIMGVLLYFFAYDMMAILTPDEAVRELGTTVLRIEAFAEPMFAASIVCYGAFVGAGDTFIPSAMNLFSMWAVRLTTAYFLSQEYGLVGVWIAMCLELCFRGLIFLIRLFWGKWFKFDEIKPNKTTISTAK